ncbi:MAG: CDP-diacylglycerol--glycerol-3-phosphate 3-phosphatidyltransferase [Chlamydiae bacterium]|nr:CDP-diacylglycerol--glycerol-3-phosphate 3-phosphatidyltransferase [Chlamydiota bacterium]
MFTLSNTLTLLRLPAAFIFIVDSVPVRLVAIILAVISDVLDGYIARKHGTVSQLGAVLDPIMDKFFVFFSLGILVATGYMPIWAMACMLSRDICLIAFGIYLSVTRGWDKLEFRSIVWGKVTTAAQFLILTLVVIGLVLPWYVYALFIPLGIMTVVSLYKGFKDASQH